MSLLLRRIKQRLVIPGKKSRQIVFGPSRGISRKLDLAYQMQSYLGLAEAETHKALYELTLGIKSAVDIGAHSGEYLLFLLVKTSATLVIGVEPDPVILGELHENLHLNNLNDRAHLELYHKSMTSLDSEKTLTLNSISDKLDGPCFIKIDVDGGETEILHGGDKLLERSDVRWLIETHSKALEDSCSQILINSGYKVRIIPNAWWRAILPEQRISEHNRWLTAVK